MHIRIIIMVFIVLFILQLFIYRSYKNRLNKFISKQKGLLTYTQISKFEFIIATPILSTIICFVVSHYFYNLIWLVATLALLFLNLIFNFRENSSFVFTKKSIYIYNYRFICESRIDEYKYLDIKSINLIYKYRSSHFSIRLKSDKPINLYLKYLTKKQISLVKGIADDLV